MIDKRSCFCANNEVKDRDLLKYLRDLLKLSVLGNAMLIPLIAANRQVIGLLVLGNQLRLNQKERSFFPFVVENMPCCEQLYQYTLSHAISYAQVRCELLTKEEQVNQTISLVDEVMRQISLKSLVETIERRLPALFDCERATVVLVHRRKKFLFRIVKDGEADTYKKF